MPREDLPILNLSNPLHKRLLIQHVKQLDGICRVEITRVRNQRSLEQNAFYYGVVLPCVAKAIAENEGTTVNTDQCHRRLKFEFLRVPITRKDTGEVSGWEVPSSADLDVKEFSDYLEKVIAFARDELMVNVPSPEDYKNPEKKAG